MYARKAKSADQASVREPGILKFMVRTLASLVIALGLAFSVSMTVGVGDAEAQKRKFSSGQATKMRSNRGNGRISGARRSGVQLGASGVGRSGSVSGRAVYSRRTASRIIGLSNNGRNFNQAQRGNIRGGDLRGNRRGLNARGSARSGVVLGGRNTYNRYYSRRLGDRGIVRLKGNKRLGINRFGRAGNIQRIGRGGSRDLPRVITPTINETFVDNSQQVIVVPDAGGGLAPADRGEYGELAYDSCPEGFTCTVRGSVSGNGPKIITLERDPEVIRYKEHKPVN